MKELQHLDALLALRSPRLPAYGLVLIAILYFAYKWALPKPIPGIPYNEKSAQRLMGDIPDLVAEKSSKGAVWGWIAETNRRLNSPITQLWTRPFGKPWVVLTDFQESYDICMHRTKEFDRSVFFGEIFTGPVNQCHVRFQTGPAFKNHRMLLNNLMAPAFLNNVAAPNIYANTLKLIDYWNLKTEKAKGHPFEAGHDVYDSALDMIFATSFEIDPDKNTTSHQVHYLTQHGDVTVPSNPNQEVVFPKAPYTGDFASIITITESFSKTVASIRPSWAYKWEAMTGPLGPAIKAKEAFFNKEIDKSIVRIATPGHKQVCAIDDILEHELTFANKQGREPDFKSRVIFDELMGFVLAGHETSSTVLRWTVKYLSASPRIQNRLRTSLRDAFPSAVSEHRNPSIAEITHAHIPYLEAFHHEASRCGNPPQSVVRQATCDTTILGHPIPKGTDIFMMMNGPDYQSPGFDVDVSQRGEHVREGKGAHFGKWDPNSMGEFAPERWLKTDQDGNEIFDANAGQFLTFGAGPRACYGRRLAYLELRVVITLIVWNFVFKETPAELSGWDRFDALTSEPKQCYVRLEKFVS